MADENEETEGTEGTGEGTTFTQADVDRIVRERLARQKAQFTDYEELKAKAAKYDEVETANKTELEQAQERAAKAEAAAQEASERATRTLTEAAITAAAAGKLADPSDALALVDRKALEYGEDGAPTNVATLIDALVEAKPHLAAGERKAPPIDQGARGGNSATDASALMRMSDADFLRSLSDPAVLKAVTE